MGLPSGFNFKGLSSMDPRRQVGQQMIDYRRGATEQRPDMNAPWGPQRSAGEQFVESEIMKHGLDKHRAARLEAERMRSRAMSPFSYGQEASDFFYSRPDVMQSLGQQKAAIGGYSRGIEGQNKMARTAMNMPINMYRAMARGGGPSFVNAAARAQRQEAQKAIGQQAMMGARGAMSPAAQRAAIMGASGVQSNMAAQVAAQRAAERQQALQNYMGAQQNKFKMLGDVQGQRGKLYDMQTQRRQQGMQGAEVAMKGAMGGHSQVADAMGNIEGLFNKDKVG